LLGHGLSRHETYGAGRLHATGLPEPGREPVLCVPHSGCFPVVGRAVKDGDPMSHVMKCGRALVFGVAATFLSGPAGAEPAYQLAQIYPAYPVYPAPPPPPPSFRRHQADAAVRSLGLTPIGPAQRQGPVFMVPAEGRDGTVVQVTLDRFSGRVLQITRIGRGAPRDVARQPLPPGYEPDDEDDYAALEEDELPPRATPPGYRGPNVVTRDPDITNSIPRSPSRPVDPLAGVPKEFRGQPAGRDEQQRLAARPPADAIPLTAPMPQPRPKDAPAVAQEIAPAATEVKPAPAPAVRDIPSAQGFE
jgi:hypothetical protein